MQDYGRAVVVGDSSTFGKGTVQNVLPLARVMDRSGLPYSYDPGALKVTLCTQRFPGGMGGFRKPGAHGEPPR